MRNDTERRKGAAMKRIMVFGDSNTYGHLPGSAHPVTGASLRYADDVRWTGVMQNELGAEYKVLEEGFCGRSTVFPDPMQHGRNGLEYLDVAFGTCAPVDLVIIMLGTNDTKDYLSASALVIYYGMATLVDALRKLIAQSNSPDAKILIINPPHLIPTADGTYIWGFSEQSTQKGRELGAYFERLANEEHLEFLDADKLEGCVPSEIDGTHLTEEAHAILGKAAAKKVKEIMG